MEIFIYDLWLLTLWIGIANWLSKLIVYFVNISSDKIDNKMVFFFVFHLILVLQGFPNHVGKKLNHVI